MLIRVNEDGTIIYPVEGKDIQKYVELEGLEIEDFTDLDLSTIRIYPVDIQNPVGTETQSAVQHTEPTLVDGNWVLGFDLVYHSNEELIQSASIKRWRLLSETDWMACSDVTMSDNWKTYRQALRDITEQDGYPQIINWPTKPI